MQLTWFTSPAKTMRPISGFPTRRSTRIFMFSSLGFGNHAEPAFSLRRPPSKQQRQPTSKSPLDQHNTRQCAPDDFVPHPSHKHTTKFPNQSHASKCFASALATCAPPMQYDVLKLFGGRSPFVANFSMTQVGKQVGPATNRSCHTRRTLYSSALCWDSSSQRLAIHFPQC